MRRWQHEMLLMMIVFQSLIHAIKCGEISIAETLVTLILMNVAWGHCPILECMDTSPQKMLAFLETCCQSKNS